MGGGDTEDLPEMSAKLEPKRQGQVTEVGGQGGGGRGHSKNKTEKVRWTCALQTLIDIQDDWGMGRQAVGEEGGLKCFYKLGHIYKNFM